MRQKNKVWVINETDEVDETERALVWKICEIDEMSVMDE